MEKAIADFAKAFAGEVAVLLVAEAKRIAVEPRNIPLREATTMTGVPLKFLKHAVGMRLDEKGFLPFSKLPHPRYPYDVKRRVTHVRTDDLWEWMKQFRRE